MCNGQPLVQAMSEFEARYAWESVDALVAWIKENEEERTNRLNQTFFLAKEALTKVKELAAK